MSALHDFLHKLVDHVGAASLHTDIDALADGEEKDAETEPETHEVSGEVTGEVTGTVTENAPKEAQPYAAE